MTSLSLCSRLFLFAERYVDISGAKKTDIPHNVSSTNKITVLKKKSIPFISTLRSRTSTLRQATWMTTTHATYPGQLGLQYLHFPACPCSACKSTYFAYHVHACVFFFSCEKGRYNSTWGKLRMQCCGDGRWFLTGLVPCQESSLHIACLSFALHICIWLALRFCLLLLSLSLSLSLSKERVQLIPIAVRAIVWKRFLTDVLPIWISPLAFFPLCFCPHRDLKSCIILSAYLVYRTGDCTIFWCNLRGHHDVEVLSLDKTKGLSWRRASSVASSCGMRKTKENPAHQRWYRSK